MNCAAVVNTEDLYVEDRLSPPWKTRVEAHVSGCPLCRERLKEQARLRAAAKEAAPKSLKERLKRNLEGLSALSAEESTAAPLFWSPHGDAWPVLVAAAVYAALAFTLAWVGGAPSQAFDKTPPAVTTEVAR
jgi:anti-sigma factor RsiW